MAGAAGAQGAAGPAGPQGPAGLAGPAGLKWRGAWDGAANYAVNDAVGSGGASWIAIAVNAGSPPPGAAWSLLAQKGDPGVQGPAGVQGSTGAQGAKGDPGVQGPAGVQGVQGLKGDTGATGPAGPSIPLNYSLQRGNPSSVVTCVGNSVWARVPSLPPAFLTTSGRPVIVQGQVRQHKTGSCTQRGHLTLKVDGVLQLDPGNLGMASSYECNAVATLNAVLLLPSGTHTIEAWEMGDNGGVCTYGTFDFIYAYELPN